MDLRDVYSEEVIEGLLKLDIDAAFNAFEADRMRRFMRRLNARAEHRTDGANWYKCPHCGRALFPSKEE